MLLNPVAPLALLLVTPYTPEVSESCLSQYYYGTHGQQNVFITDDDACLSEATVHLSSGSAVQLTDDFQQLVKDGGFIETAEYSGNCYGTSFMTVNEITKSGRRCILDIEAQVCDLYCPYVPAFADGKHVCSVSDKSRKPI